MKRSYFSWIWAFLLTILVCTMAFAAEPAEAAKPFSIELGTGHIWTCGTGNYLYSVEKTEWQYSLGLGMELTTRHGLNLNIVRDGAEVAEYLKRHNFIDAAPRMHHYTAVDLLYSYTLNPNDKFKVSLDVGPTWYSSGELDKAGIIAGASLKCPLTTHLYAAVGLHFRHVQDFIVPVANVVETRFALGFKF